MKVTDRPQIKIPLTLVDKMLELASVLVLIGFWIFTLMNYKQLPEIIPTHFDGNGNPDGYGAKWTIFALPIVSILTFIGFSILVKYPHKFNYAVTITKENAQKQYSIATSMIRILKLTIVTLFFALDYKTQQTAMGSSNGLGKGFLFLSIGLVIVPIFYFLIKSSKNN